MAKAKDQLTEAEKYRLERKKRIEKEKKKKNSYINRNRQQVQKVEKTVGIIVGCVAVCAIIFLLLSYFGVINRIVPAAKVNGQSVSVAEMNCAFADIQNQVYNASQEYEQNGNSAFYTQDTKSTDTCIYDSSKTWGEYFEEQALEHVKQIYALKDEEGNTLTEDQQKDITDTFNSLAENAKNNNFSLNAYIREAYGVGVNKSVLRSWLENIYKAQNAQTAINTKNSESISDESIKEYYQEHKEDYTSASVMAYSVRVDTSALDTSSDKELSNEEVDKLLATAKKTASKSATVIANAAKTGKSAFVKAVNAYEKKANGDNATTYKEDDLTVSGKISERMASLGESARKYISNTKTPYQSKMVYSADYENNSFVYDIIYVLSPAKAFTTINVRHILIQPSDTESDDSWKEAKEEIETIYDEFKKDPTEDNFSKIAEEKTTDEGSKDNGGLYEDVYPGQMVDTFDAWCFDSSRKTGDTGIVKTSYGYHLMYFVKNNGVYWKTQVPTDMATETSNSSIESLLEKVKVEKVSFGWDMVKLVKSYKADQKLTTTAPTDTTEAE